MNRLTTHVELTNKEYLRLVNQRDEARHILLMIDRIVETAATTARKMERITALQGAINECLSDVGWPDTIASGEVETNSPVGETNPVNSTETKEK